MTPNAFFGLTGRLHRKGRPYRKVPSRYKKGHMASKIEAGFSPLLFHTLPCMLTTIVIPLETFHDPLRAHPRNLVTYSAVARSWLYRCKYDGHGRG